MSNEDLPVDGQMCRPPLLPSLKELSLGILHTTGDPGSRRTISDAPGPEWSKAIQDTAERTVVVSQEGTRRRIAAHVGDSL
ncbi:hypothetical protein BaRGS_00032576 [Batillaria attramentaria]|uniref:Uncharacterized protein n=1 Tax=Batillaria attramentaria TaxID=370345 RepID=A0ABD0JMG5_9CAEN